MQTLRVIYFWLKNIFITGNPTFNYLEYTDYIIEGKGYFIFNWNMKNAYRLDIKSSGYRSFLKSGSAYIAVDSNIKQLEVVIKGSWRKKKILIKLNHISLDAKIEFMAKLNSSFEAKPLIPDVRPKHAKLRVYPFKIAFREQKEIIKIKNISYPN